jgi:alanyl-tRNA synthetase
MMRRFLMASIKENIDILNPNYYDDMCETVFEIYEGVYDELIPFKFIIINTFVAEATKFQKAISTGQKEWQKILNSSSNAKPEFTGEFVAFTTFDLYQKAGVPFEVSEDFCSKNSLPYSYDAVEELVIKHQELSRSNSNVQFKSGLGDSSEKTIKLHTTTHILHKVLRDKFGTNVRQMGSAITSEKARFDFALDQKIEASDLTDITTKVQAIIDKHLNMEVVETTEAKAREMGAIGLFGEKYGDKVTVYSLTDNQGNVYSREFCGGPHIKSTSEIGKFKIIKEKSVSAGVRRLEFDVE